VIRLAVPFIVRFYRDIVNRADRHRLERVAGAELLAVPLDLLHAASPGPGDYEEYRPPWNRFFAGVEFFSKDGRRAGIGGLFNALGNYLDPATGGCLCDLRGDQLPEEGSSIEPAVILEELMSRGLGIARIDTFQWDGYRSFLIGNTFFPYDDNWSLKPVNRYSWGAQWMPSEYRKEFLDVGCATVLGAIELLKCSNIRTLASEWMPHSKKQRRRGNGSIIWRDVLVRTGIVERVLVESQPHQQNQPAQRLHMVRGHFKHYEGERGLFGKITGKYWWAPHARGSPIAGVVDHRRYLVEENAGG
jgi:hypothetical protein